VKRGGFGPAWACGGALAVIALFRRLVPADSDTPWHLAEGQLLLRRWGQGDWEIGRRDTFSWTARGLSWQPNSWGFDALMAAVYDVGGWAGIALFRVALLAGLVGLAWIFSRRSGAGGWARAGAVWIGVVLVIPTGAMRPQLASFLLVLAGLELTARILGDQRSSAATAPPPGGSVRAPRPGPSVGARIVALAVIIAIWSILHGAVILGVAMIAAACAGHAVDTRTWRRPALVGLVAFGASCMSPLGVGVWTYALRTGGESRRQGIEEWQPPSLHRADDVGIVLFLLLVIVWAVWRYRSEKKSLPWALVVPSALATALTFVAVRNATFAVLACVPLLAALLEAAGAALGRRRWAPPVRSGPALAAMTIGALLAGAIQTGEFSLSPDPLGSPRYPSVAAAALPSGCRLLNEYHFGGYLILVRPEIPVSQDGRNDLYGTERLADQEQLFNTGDPVKAASELDRLGITCVLAEPSRPLDRALARDPAWIRVAADAKAQAWVRYP